MADIAHLVEISASRKIAEPFDDTAMERSAFDALYRRPSVRLPHLIKRRGGELDSLASTISIWRCTGSPPTTEPVDP